MNYSNMIEEKALKKGFIIATLVSTLVGTFTASIALHDKIQEKRDRRKQNAVDGKQDGALKQLEEKVGKLEKNGERERSRSRSSSRRRRRRRDSYAEDDAFDYSARRSRAMIEGVYEDHMLRMGQDYAKGDLITENKLQAQIIQLQQTVISVLQDALYNGRRLTEGDVQRLIAAQNAARDGSLDALEGQYTRMLAEKAVPTSRALVSSRLLEDAHEFGPPKRQITFPTRNSSTRAHRPPTRAKSLPAPRQSLFCRYSEDLQYSSQPLDLDGHCPACDVALPVDARDFWTSSLQRGYRINARFVVKCHTEDGRYACLLCNRYRRVDCICRDIDALVKHLGSEHSADEFEEDVDLVGVREREREREYTVVA